MKSVLPVLLLIPQIHAAPFIMFASASDRDVFPVLQQVMQQGDYVSSKIAAESTVLGALIGREHQYVLPGSLDGVRRQIGCGADTPGIVMYDIEHWTDTPLAEQQQPAKSITEAARIVHASKCQQYAIAPDGQYMGLKEGACSYDFEAGIYRSVDWMQVDLLSIQAQRIFSDTCAAILTAGDYTNFVTRVAAYVRGKNPAIVVVSQFSFRHTPPEQMVQAARKLTQIVDGFYLNYPTHQKTACHYCSTENVASVLRTWRPRKPVSLRE